MGFADTYHEQVFQSRRDRARRAFFWARILGVVLMLSIGVTLRADPKLRSLLTEAGMDALASLANVANPQPDWTPQATASMTQAPTLMPASRVKVNRYNNSAPADAQSIAQKLGDSLSARAPGQ
ncbi:MAG: hypothetical protein WBB25_13605 [Sulfitobacter sp.]